MKMPGRISLAIILLTFCNSTARSQSNLKSLKITAKTTSASSIWQRKIPVEISIKNTGTDTLFLRKSPIVSNNVIKDYDIRFEVQKISKGKRINYLEKCYGMDISPAVIREYIKVDSLAPDSVKKVTANIYQFCEWNKGTYRVKFRYYFYNDSLKDVSQTSEWLTFEIK